jgi:hypothetical protein
MTDKQIQKAKGEVVRLLDAERDFSRELAAKAGAVPAAEASTGEVALDGYLAGNGTAATNAAVKRTAKLHAEVEALGAAVEAARRARRASIPAVWKAQADLKREEAAVLRAQAAAIETKGAPHLAAARELFGVDFVPGANPAYFDIPLDRPLIYGVDAAPTIPQTKRAEADALDAEAAGLAVSRVRDAGMVQGGSALELAEAAWSDPFTLAPTLAEMTAWAAGAEAEARGDWRMSRLSGHLPVDDDAWHAAQLTYTLVYRGSTIVADSSTVTVARVVDTGTPRLSFDAASGAPCTVCEDR